MGVPRVWCIIFVVTAACTCGVRTECGETAQISFLTSLHDEPSCTKPSTTGVMLFEAAKLITEIYNNKTDGLHIEINVSDTCGSTRGALKAVVKALVWADINCLHPPHYLGIIGPDTVTNAEAIVKVTSILQVPHIIRKAAISPYLHQLEEESNSYIVQAILKIVENLDWKSFTLVINAHDQKDNDVQDIEKKLTMSAIAKNLCVIIHDDDKDFMSHIIYIGKPDIKFFNKFTNATILIFNEGNSKNYLNRIDPTNTILLLEESRNEDFNDLEWRVEKSQWWMPGNGRGKYDAEELKQIRWLEKAIEIYVKALNAACKNTKCKNQINVLDWNHIISNMLMTHNAESQAAPRFLDLSVKTKVRHLEHLGSVIVRKNKTKIYWGEFKSNNEKEDDLAEKIDESYRAKDTSEDVPYAFRRLVNKAKESRTNCATTIKKVNLVHESDNEAAQIIVSEMDDTEWWTTVCMVSGVGMGMFLVGSLAVYVVYVNIREPRCPKDKNQLDRDTSLRRVGSDKEPATIAVRNKRAPRPPQRMDSNRSSVSERSV